MRYRNAPPRAAAPRRSALALGLAVALAACPAVSGARKLIELPEHDFAVGPSLAYVYDRGHGLAANVDASYTYSVFTASLNLKLVHAEGRTSYGPQAELCAWLGANLGGGVGYLFGTERGPVYHVFVGVPFGDDWLPQRMQPFHSLYLEPYYRLNFFVPGGLRLVHEAGVLIKITTYTI